MYANSTVEPRLTKLFTPLDIRAANDFSFLKNQEISPIRNFLADYKPQPDTCALDSKKNVIATPSNKKDYPAEQDSVFAISLKNISFKKFIDFVKESKVDPYEDYSWYRQELQKILEPIIPIVVKKRLHDLSIHNKTSVILLSDFPVTTNKLPITPDSDRIKPQKDFLSESLMIAISGMLNSKPYVLTDEKSGLLAQQIIQLEKDAYSSSGTGYKVDFGLHTENVHEATPPRFFFLFCLRGDENANTIYLEINSVTTFLDEKTSAQLQEPNYVFKTGNTFHQAKQLHDAILQKNSNGIYEVRLNTAPGRTEGIDEESEHAKNNLINLINEYEIPSFNLKAGDLLILDNRKVMHGRSSFELSTSYEQRRWLQRMYLHSITEDQSLN